MLFQIFFIKSILVLLSLHFYYNYKEILLCYFYFIIIYLKILKKIILFLYFTFKVSHIFQPAFSIIHFNLFGV